MEITALVISARRSKKGNFYPTNSQIAAEVVKKASKV